jgi:hypothetical protein
MGRLSLDQWEQFKQDVLAALAEVKFAPVYHGLENAKPSGDGWMLARCPLHKDERPSLGYSTATGQWSCFSGCGKGDAFEFLVRTTGRPFKEVLLSLGEGLGLPPPSANGDSTGQIVYEYRDEAGALLFQVLRGAGKKFFQRRPGANNGWVNNLKGVRRVLYRLPDLLARPAETVFVVEGEKDVDRLHAAGLLATTNSGGAGKWRESHSESLRGRTVVILPDNDTPGGVHADQVVHALTGVADSVKIVALPGLPDKGDVSDWLAAGHTVAELQDLVVQAPLWESRKEESTGGSYPVILVSDRQQRDIVADAWQALLARNDPPALFNFAGKLARLVAEDRGLAIQPLSHAAAYGTLIRTANWVQQRGDKLRDAKPPVEVAGDILANPHPDLPPLEAVLSTPVFDAGWRLISAPGYHRETRVWLHLTEDAATYDVPIRPSDDDLAAARGLLLDDLLVDFPFTADSDRAHAVAALLLPFARRMFEGPTPIHLLEAPSPGSGKSLLADLITIIALGETAGATTLTRDESETRKKITALLARGRAVISIDNVEGGLSSSQIASAITTEVWDDRVLGQTQMVTPPNKALWLISANNPNLSLEIARRCVRVRLNPAEEQPWKRTGFKHDAIQQWAKKNRPALVRSVLTIIRSWISAGAPQGAQTLGSFEGWSRTIGGIVTHLGLPGFLGDADEFYATADSDSGEWAAFVAAWWGKHHGSPVRVTELLELAASSDLVAFACTGASDSARKAKFGKSLNGLRDRKFGEVEVAISNDSHTKARLYRLRSLGAELFPVGVEAQ